MSILKGVFLIVICISIVFLYLFISGNYEWMIIQDSQDALIKYSLLIMAANITLVMPILAYLRIMGKFQPGSTQGLTKVEKAKMNVYFSIGFLPSYICGLSILLSTDSTVGFFASCLLLYFGYEVIRDIALIRRHPFLSSSRV